MIKNIVFDMGNVIIRFDRDAFIDRFGVSEEERKILLREIFLSPEWVMMDRGTLTDEQAADILCPRVPEHLQDIARKLIGGESGRLIPFCALAGGGFVTLCDLASRLVFAPYELPAGILMSFLGGPFFIWLLLKRKDKRP